MKSTALKSGVPSMWKAMLRAFEEGAMSFANVADEIRQERERHTRRIQAQRKRLSQTSVSLDLPAGVRAEMERAVRETLSLFEREHAQMLDAVERILEDFEHAEENEDRFIVLAFGEVNAGKTALANHVAGFDFDLPEGEVRAEAFLGEATVARLEERETECTREYQGFRLPGILWIDCPGVLSTTAENSDLARRLVSRADFLLFVSSSDAPFKRTEMDEMARLIHESGNRRLEGWLVLTKMDQVVEEEDPDTGELRKRIEPKPERSLLQQQEWTREQVQASKLSGVVRKDLPLPVSVYIGRDRLGRAWKTGDRKRAPVMGWDRQYDASGMSKLFRLLTRLVQEEGPRLKAEWPRKRAAALRRRVDATSKRVLGRIDNLLAEIVRQREEFAHAMKEAEEVAANLARERVKPCLGGNRIFRAGQFDRVAAARDLQAHLQNQVGRVVAKRTREAFQRVDQQIHSALAELSAETAFALDLQQRTRQKTYTSTTKGEAWGKAIVGTGGAAGGGYLGAAIGTAIAPGIGTAVGSIIGMLVGGILGGEAGSAVGGKVYEETVTIEVPAGTNVDQVISETERMMAGRASEAVRKLHAMLDRNVLGHLETEVRRMRDAVREWSAF